MMAALPVVEVVAAMVTVVLARLGALVVALAREKAVATAVLFYPEM
jgi:hypothetical protein